jgi:hypothetical protein
MGSAQSKPWSTISTIMADTPPTGTVPTIFGWNDTEGESRAIQPRITLPKCIAGLYSNLGRNGRIRVLIIPIGLGLT